MWRSDKNLAITFTPRAQLASYSGGVTSGYMEAPLSSWFNTNSSNTPIHYGYKLGIDTTDMGAVAGTIGYARVFVKTYFSVKEPK
jgi:hypothetical protein